MNVENNLENRRKLAEAVVESYDLDTLIESATDGLADFYSIDADKFQEDYEEMFGELEE